jgi:hypothetical protein
MHNASSIFYSIYKEFKKLWYSEQDAIFYWDLAMEKVMANPLFDWKSFFQSKYERWVGSLMTSFMTFWANAFSNRYVYGGWLSRAVLESSRNWKTPTTRLIASQRIKWIIISILIMGIISWIIEDWIRQLNWKIFNQKEYPEDLKVKAINKVIQEIPILSQLMWQNKYWSFLGLKGFNSILDSIKWMYDWKEDQTKINNAWKFIFSSAEMFWFPAVFQKIWKGYFKEEVDKQKKSKLPIKKVKLKRPTLKRPQIKRPI